MMPDGCNDIDMHKQNKQGGTERKNSGCLYSIGFKSNIIVVCWTLRAGYKTFSTVTFWTGVIDYIKKQGSLGIYLDYFLWSSQLPVVGILLWSNSVNQHWWENINPSRRIVSVGQVKKQTNKQTNTKDPFIVINQ